MNIIDIVIIIVLVFGFILGFLRGFTKELVNFLGLFVVLILSFILKNPISIFLYKNLPFLNFEGIFKDVTVLNILLYETIAFIFVFAVLFVIFKILLFGTKIFEKILKMTIILGIPSKILGGILGIVENWIYVFIVLYLLKLPMFDMNLINKSNMAGIVYNHTPVLNVVCDKTLSIVDEISELKEEYKTTNDSKKFNQKVLNSMIEKGVITRENAQYLIDKKKIEDVKIN